MAPRLLLLPLLLACVAVPAMAREAALMDANGAGSACPVTAEEGEVVGQARAGKSATVAPSPAKPASSRRGGEGEASVRPPRWHSFLPGMIR